MGHRLWNRHPAVRTGGQLTVGERAADMMRNGMGSWPFVICFVAVLVTWMLLNSHLLLAAHGRKPVDPYPWILLNLGLSMVAAVQGAALLIAAKRADRIAAEIALHTEANTESIKQLLELNTDLTRDMHAHLAHQPPPPPL